MSDIASHRGIELHYRLKVDPGERRLRYRIGLACETLPDAY
jgi:hypothetical protein